MTRTRLAVTLGLAALPAARLGLDAVAEQAAAGDLLLIGLGLLGAIAAIALGAISRLDLAWQAPAALAHAAAAGALAVIPPYDERTAGFVVYSILLVVCAFGFATRWTGRQARAPERAATGARVASRATWVLAALGIAAGVVIVVANMLVVMVADG
jgi:hypothetical protein